MFTKVAINTWNDKPAVILAFSDQNGNICVKNRSFFLISLEFNWLEGYYENFFLFFFFLPWYPCLTINQMVQFFLSTQIRLLNFSALGPMHVLCYACQYHEFIRFTKMPLKKKYILDTESSKKVDVDGQFICTHYNLIYRRLQHIIIVLLMIFYLFHYYLKADTIITCTTKQHL